MRQHSIAKHLGTAAKTHLRPEEEKLHLILLHLPEKKVIAPILLQNDYTEKQKERQKDGDMNRENSKATDRQKDRGVNRI